MHSCLIIFMLLFFTQAWGAECKILFAKEPLQNMLGLTPSRLTTHHLSQLSLQQNIKAINELSVGRPVDLKLYKEILQKDPFAEDLALSAARLSAHGLLNSELIYKKDFSIDQIQVALEIGHQTQRTNLESSNSKNNVVYLNSSKQQNKNSITNNSKEKGNNVVPIGSSLQQILNAGMSTYNLYNSGAVKMRLLQVFHQMKITTQTINELKALSSGQLLSFKAAYKLSGSEVIALKAAHKAGSTMDTASFVFLAHRAKQQLFKEQAFLELFYKRIKIKQPSLSEIIEVSEMIFKGELGLGEVIGFLSEKSRVSQMSQWAIFSLLQVAKIIEFQKRNKLPESSVNKVFDHNSYLANSKGKIKRLLFQRKTIQGFRIYDLRDDSLLSSRLYSLLKPEIVTSLALNPGMFKVFVETFQAELQRLLPYPVSTFTKHYILRPQDPLWEMRLYNNIISEAFSKAEKSL